MWSHPGLPLRGLAAAAVALAAAGCSYQYDDGLPPLGQREASASASADAAEASASADAAKDAAREAAWRRERAARSASWAPLDQILSGPALRAWANAMLSDGKGETIALDSGAVWPGTPGRTTSVQAPAGTAALTFACRGTSTAHVVATVDGTPVVDTEFECNRAWVRTVVVSGSGSVEVAFTAGDAPSSVAYRLARA